MKSKIAPSRLLSWNGGLLVWSLAFALLAMAPTLGDFSHHKYGPNLNQTGSDSYGLLAHLWVYAQPADGVIRTETQDLISGYPEGRPVPKFNSITGWLAAIVSKLSGSPVLGYNLVIFLDFFLAFLLSYLLFNFVLSHEIALLLAFTLALSPYQVLQSVDHLDLTATWVILFFLIAAYQVVVANKPVWIAGTLIAVGISSFCHPYFTIMLAILTCFVGVFYLFSWWRGKTKISKHVLLGSGAAGGVAAGMVLWSKHLLTEGYAYKGMSSLNRSISDLYVYSTKVWDFVLPPIYSSLFSDVTNPFKTEQTAQSGSNYVENTLYPGAIVLVLLAILLVFAVFNFADFRSRVRSQGRLAIFIASLIAVPILFSMSPSFDVLGVAVPTPSMAVFQVIDSFRTLSRFGYIADIGLIFLAGIMLNALFKYMSLRPQTTRLILAIAVVVSLLDFGILGRSFYSDTSAVPAVYKKFSEVSNEQSVVLELPFMWGYISYFWESYHHRRNFGLFDAGTKNFIELTSQRRSSLNDWIDFAKEHHITHIILHNPQRIQIPGAIEFVNDWHETDISFAFAKYSYLIDLQKW